MKGIIIAGGNGTRLTPLTKVISKALLPVYDKPMIYYPLSILMEAEITDILIITTPQDKKRYIELLGNGSHLGLSIVYEVEPNPKGIAQAFIIGEKFIGDEPVTLILGDNIFSGDVGPLIKKSKNRKKGATVFGYQVKDPERFGVVELDEYGKAIALEEKPLNPKTNIAVTGLYIYDNQVIEIAKNLVPSDRGELEITDVNKEYLATKTLHVELLKEEVLWFDTGTHQSLQQANQFVKEVEQLQNKKIGCIEEIAFKKGLITRKQLYLLAKQQIKSEYGDYLLKVAKNKHNFLRD
ncbi:glucose-1-phosphate thymidylyltransferase RfbA [Metabacillus halosaccharovorans]|uniref:glucose-1-phosphate thymidylyltransferase RfbA n=1 Tax=Metabacillus halosaccharovorans TaxID=930124 RepID=UPI00203F7E6C|nr:glucose-1-phosphate thymidylyltransferase RfbA [Metabacillus halosaccharovorans]MCM3439696.1 glucose-1-phosphate thymidylyltransferase RfbA [Metabacillus halosaccharovorans]